MAEKVHLCHTWGAVDLNLNKGGWAMKANADKTMAEYFGLRVEVLCEMNHCALIRFRDREFVIDASDLVFIRQLWEAA